MAEVLFELIGSGVAGTEPADLELAVAVAPMELPA